MINKRVTSLAAALDGLAPGHSVMISGFGGAGVPYALIGELGRREVGELELIVNGVRHVSDVAPQLFSDARVRKVVCSAARGRGREPDVYEKQWFDGALEIEMVPQGTLAERIRAGGAGIAAFFTPTAVGTSLADGKEVRVFNGREHVLESALVADFALLRAHSADRLGNVRFHGSQGNFGPSMASAARIAVVEVEQFVEGELGPREIDIPGVYVQRVVVVPRGAAG